MTGETLQGGGGIFHQPSHTYVFFSLRCSASTEMEFGEIKVLSLLHFCLDFFLWLFAFSSSVLLPEVADLHLL